MQRKMTLRGILNKQINYYLSSDNPQPERWQDKFLSFFSEQGEKGRLRARRYLEEIAKQTDSELLLKVYRDFNNVTDSLHNSNLLRRRIGEGLCEYLNLLPQLTIITENQYGPLCEAATYGCPLPSYNRIRDSIMAALLERKIRETFDLEQINDVRHIVLQPM